MRSDYPSDYLIDCHIVHQIAFAKTRDRGQTLEQDSVADLIRDLKDVFRFNVARESKTERLIDRLLANPAGESRK